VNLILYSVKSDIIGAKQFNRVKSHSEKGIEDTKIDD
jgi:hypothetical protein